MDQFEAGDWVVPKTEADRKYFKRHKIPEPAQIKVIKYDTDTATLLRTDGSGVGAYTWRLAVAVIATKEDIEALYG